MNNIFVYFLFSQNLNLLFFWAEASSVFWTYVYTDIENAIFFLFFYIGYMPEAKFGYIRTYMYAIVEMLSFSTFLHWVYI